MSVLYADYPVASEGSFADFRVRLEPPRSHRRWWQPQVLFEVDGAVIFEPFPREAALPLFEWGFNWCIAKRSHQFLMLHSAVVAKDGNAVLMPALPGSGKSTLCAALVNRGWRLLSDEFGLVDPGTGMLVPAPRPIPLKNQSIDVIRRFAPDATLGPSFPKTRKGTVAHMRAPVDSVRRMDERASPRRIIFPRYETEAHLSLEPLSKDLAFLRLANNSFNYQLLGADGFRTVERIVRHCEVHQLTYSDLDEAIARFDDLAR